MIYVTHDQVEAMTMGHRIAILERGVLQQIGAPQDVYARPANLFVARFIGSPPMNVITGRVGKINDTVTAEIPGGHIPLDAPLATAVTMRGLGEVVIGVRPEDIRFDGSEGITARVTVVESLGHERHVVCRLLDNQLVIVRQNSHDRAPAVGETAYLVAEPAALHVFDPTGDRVDG